MNENNYFFSKRVFSFVPIGPVGFTFRLSYKLIWDRTKLALFLTRISTGLKMIFFFF